MTPPSQSRRLPATLMTQLGPDRFYESVTTHKSALPRLTLVSKGRFVDQGIIEAGHYGIWEGEDDISSLGASVDVLPLACRPKALDTTEEVPLAVYDETLPEFHAIVSRAADKDSGCMYGASFLVAERSTQRFCELFFGNKSMRALIGEFREFLPLTKADLEARGLDARQRDPRPVTLTSQVQKQARYSWHVPVLAACSKEFSLPQGSSEIVEEFINQTMTQRTC